MPVVFVKVDGKQGALLASEITAVLPDRGLNGKTTGKACVFSMGPVPQITVDEPPEKIIVDWTECLDPNYWEQEREDQEEDDDDDEQFIESA